MDFSWLYGVGGMFSMYVIGQLLHNLSLYLEDNKRSRTLSRISSYSSVLFYFLGAPVSVIVYILHIYPQKRIRKFGEADGKKKTVRFYEDLIGGASIGDDYHRHIREVLKKETEEL
ncbi:MAG: hypothetical protein E7443_04500 [Ruminococcaceae bacterium]|nr:hypothetical protein [Oscillospiraceae bacterium]